MIKVLNSLLNLNVQGGNTFYDKNKEDISSLFLSILLNLIDESLSRIEDFSKGVSTSEIFNENTKGSQNLMETTTKDNDLDLIKLCLLQIFNDSKLTSFEGKGLIDLGDSDLLDKNPLLNTQLNWSDNNVKGFEFNEEKLFLIKEIIFSIFNNSNREVDFSQLNQTFEKVFYESNVNNISDLIKKLSQNKDELLINKKTEWLMVEAYLNKIKDSNGIEIKTDVSANPQKYNESIQLNKDDLKFYINIFQNNNKQKKEVNQNLQLENNRSNLNNNHALDFYLNKKYTNQDELRGQFVKDVFNLRKDSVTLILNNDDLVAKKGELFEEELKFNNHLEKRFKIEANDFQKFFDGSLIKIDFRIENIVKSENIKTVEFHKFPSAFLEIIKKMSFEIQPEGEKRAFIKLEPPEMGYLDLEIKVKNKDIEMVVRIEKFEVFQEIKQNLQHIKATFEESGFNLKDFQIFLGSGFDSRTWAKDFGKKEKSYSQRPKVEEIEEIDEKNLKSENLMSFYNRNGKYYYIV